MHSTNLISSASKQMGVCSKLHLAKQCPLICHHLICTARQHRVLHASQSCFETQLDPQQRLLIACDQGTAPIHLAAGLLLRTHHNFAAV